MHAIRSTKYIRCKIVIRVHGWLLDYRNIQQRCFISFYYNFLFVESTICRIFVLEYTYHLFQDYLYHEKEVNAQCSMLQSPCIERYINTDNSTHIDINNA